jgi:homoserine kinase
MAEKIAKPAASTRVEDVLKAALGGRTASARASGVVDHKLTSKGLELKLFIPKEKLTTESTRELVSLIMSDMM